MNGRTKFGATVVILFTAFAFAYTLVLLLNLWSPALSTDGDDRTVSLFFGTGDVTTNREVILLLLAVTTGALGSLLFMARSAAYWIGNSEFANCWLAWYLTRPLVGIGIAFLAYAAVRAGFLNVSGDPEEINVYGIATIAGLSGLFCEKVSKKLKQLVETLFAGKEEEDGNGASTSSNT